MGRGWLVVALIGSTGSAWSCSDPGGGGGGVVLDTAETRIDALDATFPDGTTGTCVNGERRCSGQVAQQCVNGSFQNLFECPSTQVCEAGACRAGDGSVAPDTTPSEVTQPDTTPTETVTNPCVGRECGPNGQGGSCGTCLGTETCNAAGQCVPQCVPDCDGKECGSDLCGSTCGSCFGGEQCVQGSCEPTEVCDCAGAVCGVDNCGNSCGTCSGQTTCSGGRCVSTTSGSSCTEIIDCIYDDVAGCLTEPDDAAFEACANLCYGEGSATGVAEFDAYLGCLQACPQPDGNDTTTADDLAYARCSYSQCSEAEAMCVLDASGGGTCFGILDCFDFCAEGDGACYQACWESGTEAAQAALWGLDACLTVECPDATDEFCVDEAIAGACADLVFACQTN